MKKLLALLLLLVWPCSPANVLTITKTAFEVFDLSVDFGSGAPPPIASGDTATLSAVSSINASTGVDSSATMIAAFPIPAFVGGTKKVVFAVQGGAARQIHTVSVKVVNVTTGEKFEGRITVTVN